MATEIMRFRNNPYAALAILTALNLLNFIDRSILFQVQGMIQQEFAVSKMQIGLLTTAFTICLIMALPVLGSMADRYPRRPIIITGAIVWSIATLLTALRDSFLICSEFYPCLSRAPSIPPLNKTCHNCALYELPD